MDRDPINLIKIIEAPGGDDDLFLLRVDMSEGLSQLFRYKLTLSAHRGRPKPIEWLGQSVTFTIGTDPATAFKVNGQVSSFEIHRLAGNFTEFSIDLVPSLWTARLSQNSRMFQNMDVRAIIAAVLKDYPDVKFEDKCKTTYPKREYCLQYRETDFDFISRLMEEEGIFYFFRFGKAGRYQHILYLGDDTSAYFEGMPKKLQYRSVETADNVHDMSVATQAIVGKRTTRSYDYLEPPKKLQAEVPSKLNWADKRTESYDYPLIYKDVGEGNRQAKMFMERHEAWSAVVQGSSTYLSLVPGGRHDVSDEQQLPPHKKIVMIAVSQSIHDSENANTGGSYHVGSFTAIPSDVTFRPQRSTPRPLIPGTQRAVVVGPPGEEIYTDEHGRLKVQFMWDREGKKDAKSSCWIRYMQQWAGPGYGAQWIPRIGMEVLVSFLEGDPDQPVVIGCLYNGDNKVPLELEARKTQSGWRTVSSKGKGKRQEFIFEDKAGSEEVYLYGQRNHRVVFDEDESIKIGKNQANSIGANQSTEVGGNRDIKVQGNQKTAVTGSTDLESLSDVRWSAAAGTVKYSMSNGMFNLEAAMSITLKAGASSISIGPAGISITGTPMVLINSGGGGGSASAAQKAKVQAVLDKLADRKAKGGSGAWTDPRKLGALAGNTSKKGGASAAAQQAAGAATVAQKNAPPPATQFSKSVQDKIALRKERQGLVAGGKASSDPKKQAAAGRFERNIDAMEKAKLSAHVYKPGDPVPTGWTNASNDPKELAKLGLRPGMLETKDSEFRAQVYKPDPAVFGPNAKPVVVFKGTTPTSIEDWKNNLQQGANLESSYYKNAVEIGKRANMAGAPVEFAGHSLGGGMASAASRANGGSATTFNSAGLNPATVAKYGGSPVNSAINAYRVDGEILTRVQEFKPSQYESPAWSDLWKPVQAAGKALRNIGRVAADTVDAGVAYLAPNAVGTKYDLPSIKGGNPVARHGMDQVIDGIESQKVSDAATLKG
jgi:type VI secretion system VgrG family protein